jgi:hypothetical protein
MSLTMKFCRSPWDTAGGLFMRVYLIALTLFGFLTGCGNGIQPPSNIHPREPNVVSLDPQNWYIYYSAGMPPHPSAGPEGVWSFEFPTSKTGGHVNYLQTPFNATTILHHVNMTFEVESDTPQYNVIDPSDILPATVHIFFEQQNDDLRDPNGRWWAGASGYNLGSQDNRTITLIVPLTPDHWSNVYGKNDPNAFYAALNNVGWIGLTCGGQYFWGHGVALDNSKAKFILIDFHTD